MSTPARIDPSVRPVGGRPMTTGPARDSLADILERVLDKGVVIVGDVVVSIVDIELLTLKLRLFISSADTALHMGLDWWRNDPFFSGQGGADSREELDRLRARVAELEARLPGGDQPQSEADGTDEDAGPAPDAVAQEEHSADRTDNG